MSAWKLPLCLFGLLLFRLYRWVARIRTTRKRIPAVPVLFPTTSRFRLLFPKKWQVYHRDWHMQFGRAFYRDSDIVAMISLFGHDQLFVTDPAAILEMNVSGRFQKDLVQASQVESPRIELMNRRLRFTDQMLFPQAEQNGKFIAKSRHAHFPRKRCCSFTRKPQGRHCK